MTTTYRGQELSLHELFSAFSQKVEEISTDPDRYVVQAGSQTVLPFTCA